MTSGRRGALAGGLAAVLLLTVAACNDDPATIEFEVIDEVSFASQFITAANDTFDFSLGNFTEMSTGVWFQDLTVGVGDTAVIGDTVFVRYNGWLRDGQLFDDGAFSYTFLRPGVIAGFQFGMQGMQPGGERLVLVPPEWGYGTTAAGAIYPGAVLVFNIGLDSIHAVP